MLLINLHLPTNTENLKQLTSSLVQIFAIAIPFYPKYLKYSDTLFLTISVLKFWRCLYVTQLSGSIKNLGPVVQSVVSLTNLLWVISLTVLVDSIHSILIFFGEKM